MCVCVCLFTTFFLQGNKGKKKVSLQTIHFRRFQIPHEVLKDAETKESQRRILWQLLEK